MIGLLNYKFDQKPNGLETSEIQRCFNFVNQGYDAKLISLLYDAQHKYNEVFSGLGENTVINMYDFLQSVPQNLEPVKYHPTYYEIGLGQDTYVVPNEETHVSKVVKDDRVIAYITFFEGTDQVKSINWLNKYNKIFKFDEYDSRGFMSRQTFYDENENVRMMEYLNPKGETAISMRFKTQQNGEVVLERIRLNFEHNVYLFKTENELYRFFFQKAFSKEDKIICERMDLVEDVLKAEGDYERYFTIQSHTENYLKLKGQPVNATIKLLEQYADKVSAVITATSKQREDLISCYPNLKAIPFKIHGASLAIEQELEHRPRSKRNQFKFVSAMSFYETRHPLEMIQAFGEVVKLNQKVSLSIFTDEKYNYDPVLHMKCTNYIKENGLESNIKICGYANDIDSELDSAIGYLDFDEFDIQPIGLLSAIAHGTPSVVLKAPYGKPVKDKKQGYVITKNELYQPEKVAEKINELINCDDKQWNELSKKNYQMARQYYPEKVMKQWKFLLK